MTRILSDDEIRRKIAEIAGYRVMKYKDLYYMLEPHKTIEQVTRALEKNFYAAISYGSEEAVWKFNKRYPDWPKSMDACWLLFQSFGLLWDVKATSTGEYGCKVIESSEGFEIVLVSGIALTPARAMCEAFLNWNDIDV